MQVFPKEHIIPDIEEWPINKFANNRSEFIDKLVDYTYDKFIKTVLTSKHINESLPFSPGNRIFSNLLMTIYYRSKILNINLIIAHLKNLG